MVVIDDNSDGPLVAVAFAALLMRLRGQLVLMPRLLAIVSSSTSGVQSGIGLDPPFRASLRLIPFFLVPLFLGFEAAQVG